MARSFLASLKSRVAGVDDPNKLWQELQETKDAFTQQLETVDMS